MVRFCHWQLSLWVTLSCWCGRNHLQLRKKKLWCDLLGGKTACSYVLLYLLWLLSVCECISEVWIMWGFHSSSYDTHSLHKNCFTAELYEHINKVQNVWKKKRVLSLRLWMSNCENIMCQYLYAYASLHDHIQISSSVLWEVSYL